ncbi:hypothetical protein C442_18005 [Haloarcula amylolytica JCM 13557]|uniref:Uncharacterized protein n=2 Tax=Haloarcula amylolytica TaxID=396317 RepID=M0KAJ8_9EURY|nr:hypothetical protein C442_18005 [Haloarcula amylolytica JCM 13557]
MAFFGSTDTVDQKAQTVLDDLSEDPSPFEILQTADQQTGDDVDPETVVTRMRNLDDAVDAKLGAVEGSDVDQKAMRDAAGAVADRTPLQEADALDLLSAAADSAEQQDPSTFLEAFSDVAGVDQNALTDTLSTDMTDPTNSDSTDSDATPDGGVDQKQDGGDDDAMDPIDLVEEIGGSDAADTVESYADSVGKDIQEAAAEWVSENVPGVTVEGHGDSSGSPNTSAPAPAQPDMNGDDYDRDPEPDQMLDDASINERVADAVTSDEVLDEMAGAVAQKLATDDDLADELVGTVEQKGDFATTDETVTTAPEGSTKTVGEAGAVTGGGNE